MNVVIYARFSSNRQNETSIEAQLDECYRYCKQNNYQVIGEYIDKAISAKTDDRPDFQRMILDSSKHMFEGIVVYQLDRFSRSREDSAHYKHKLKKNGVKVISAKEHISDDASGILIESVLEGMAEYYSVELSQKVKRNLKQNAERGWFNGGYPPFGYKVVTVDCGTYKKKKLEPDVELVPVVKEVFEMRANSTKLLDIVEYLNDKGYRTVMGNKFQKSSLENMFRNKRYIGISTFDGVEYPNTVPAIIDEELFDRVQEVVQKYKHSPAIAKADEEYILTTKMFCGKCNEAMVGICGTSRNGDIYKYYMCMGRRKKKCSRNNIPKNLIEDFVVNQCKEILSESNIDLISKKVYSMCQEKNQHNCLLNALEKKMRTLDKNIENLIKAIEAGQNIDLINKKINENRIELEEVKKQHLAESRKIINLTEEKIKVFLEGLRDNDIDSMNSRRILINLFINKIYVYDEDVTIIFKVGKNSITVNKKILAEVNTNLKKAAGLYLGNVSPP